MTRRTKPARTTAPVLRLFASLDLTAENWHSWRRRGGGWTTTPRTWPRTGTLRDGRAYALTTPRPRPTAHEAAAALLPTPTAADGTGGPGTSPHRTGGPNLRTLVTALPEPAPAPPHEETLFDLT